MRQTPKNQNHAKLIVVGINRPWTPLVLFILLLLAAASGFEIELSNAEQWSWDSLSKGYQCMRNADSKAQVQRAVVAAIEAVGMWSEDEGLGT
jgi:hypothetical protein